MSPGPTARVYVVVTSFNLPERKQQLLLSDMNAQNLKVVITVCFCIMQERNAY